MGELRSADHDLDRYSIDSPFDDTTCVNPISRALEDAGMPNWMRPDWRFSIARGGRAAVVYSVSDTVQSWLRRWTEMSCQDQDNRSNESSLQSIHVVVDHATRFIHSEPVPDQFHRIVLTPLDRVCWMLLLFIEEETDPEKRATMARQLSEVFDVEEEAA